MTAFNRREGFYGHPLLRAGAAGQRRRRGLCLRREIVRFFAAARWALSRSPLLWRRLPALFLCLAIAWPPPGRPAFPACARRASARASAGLHGAVFLLSAVTGGAMLAACAELSALVWPIRPAYAAGFFITLPLAVCLAAHGARGLAAVGGALCALTPVLLARLLCLPEGEACFFPAGPPDRVLRAALDGALYAALNAAMMAGALPTLLALSARKRRACVALLVLLFGLLLTLGMLVCQRHLQSVAMQPLPFVWLSRRLGSGGYLLVALCLYAAALSTLCAMLCAMANLLPRGLKAGARLILSACSARRWRASASGASCKAATPFWARSARRCCSCSPCPRVRTRACPPDSRSNRSRSPPRAPPQALRACRPRPRFARHSAAAR